MRRVQLEQQGLRARLVQQGPQVRLEPLVLQVRLVLQVQLVLQVRLVLLEPLEQRGLQVLQARRLQVHQE